ncbi:hypothetical protein MPC4_220054 [Methylocella tundrae]|uniref:Uncharacterized protein n=1 Tax=Methylocella tundrae TaxID=227605 RepID=A0A8B6M669_METTU|nr:hypothetical protein MPC4_220054 [Methylocella tundrae]
MKKRRNTKGRAAGGNTPKSTSQPPASTTPKQIEATQPEPTRSEKPRAGFPIMWFWKEFWAFAGPILTLTSAWFLLSPQISIEPSVNLDPSQPVATQFLITNRGHVPVYDVHFGCGFGGGGAIHIGHLKLSMATMLPVRVLPPGVQVTRNCAVESDNIQVPDISITATYTWPVIRWQGTQTAHFSLRHGTPGFFLVPDLN